MKASFENFMTGLIDYAGMFPPAALDIETAQRNYTDYLEGGDSWMLGRYIIPATQLHRAFVRPDFRFSVIVSPEMPKEELDQLSIFKGCVEMVETRVPEDNDSPARCSDHLLRLKTGLAQTGLQGVQLFVEAENVTAVASAIATFNNSNIEGEVVKNAGFKFRCGGLKKQPYPSPEKVTEAISTCCDHDIPIKFTAGMHHPLGNNSPEIRPLQHGFINIFGAALLYWTGNLSKSEITECLCDKAASHFHFTKEHFSWREKTISAGEIERLRLSKVISFGSCSFTEPVEGLSSLGFASNSGV